VTVGKKMPTKTSIPTLENQLQQPVNQLMLQQLQVLFITVVIGIKRITLNMDASRRRKTLKRRIQEEKCHYAFKKLQKSVGLLQSYTFIADSG
jgi:hypothetical protein